MDLFDPIFLNISPKEAEWIDPQERLFLETAWNAIEDSGYCKSTLWGKPIGVYVGVMYGHYEFYALENANGTTIMPSSSFASIANRVSYFFNFQGPSIALDTMCSSSLTAIHMACESLKSNEIEMAIAGGVNLSVHKNKYFLLSQSKFLSSDGRCRSFGEGGDGYVPGEGVGAVLLKPLSKARNDKDRIYGIIKASALNHGGKTNGYTVPNPIAQGQVIMETLNKAKIDPLTISYIEAHGTGTSLGDPIEITGLQKSLGNYFSGKRPLAIGSVKSNIGHLEAAAGIAALTKVLLQMKYKTLAPSLHSDRLNPNISFQKLPFYVPQQLETWEQPIIGENGDEQKVARRAGISSFGAGGANAHLIVEEFESSEAIESETDTNTCLFILSAKNEDRLKTYMESFRIFLESIIQKESVDANDEKNEKQPTLRNITYTLQVGREPMDERLAIVTDSLEDLVEKLKQSLLSDAKPAGVYVGNKNKDQTDPTSDAMPSDKPEVHLKSMPLSDVAKLWISGADPDWKSLYGDKLPSRVSLPTYPFKKKRYWVDSYLKQKGLEVQNPSVSMNSPRSLTIDTKPEAKASGVSGNSKLKLKQTKTLIAPDANDLSTNHSGIKTTKTSFDRNQSRQSKEDQSKTARQTELPFASEVDEAALMKMIKGKIKKELAGILHMEPDEIDDDTSMQELGIDSIGVVELVNALNRAFKTNMKAMLIYDQHTVAKLTNYLLTQRKQRPNVQPQVSAKTSESVNTEPTKPENHVPDNKLISENSAIQSHPSETVSPAPNHSTRVKETGMASSSQDDGTILSAIKTRISEELSELLHMTTDEIDENTSVQEYGLDSIGVVELIGSLNTAYGLDLKAPVLYNNHTVAKLSAHILPLYKQRLKEKKTKEKPNISKPPSQQLETNRMLPSLDDVLRSRQSNIDKNPDGESIEQSSSSQGNKISLKGIKGEKADKPQNTGKLKKLRNQSPPPLATIKSTTTIPLAPVSKPNRDKVAVIGMAGRFPGARNISEFWNNLKNGVDSVTEVPKARWDIDAYFDPDPKKPFKTYCKWGGFLDDVDKFDPAFFRISPAEAEAIDPQQRLFLEECYKALEDAGYSEKTLSGLNCGVYVGIVNNNEYMGLLSKAQGHANLAYSMLGNANSILASRISYFLNLKGPAVSVDSACSSSLVAIDKAYKSICSGDTDMMLAGGVLLCVSSQRFIMTSKTGALSAKGRCAVFDNSADGYVPGEAVGVIVLKNLTKAIADGDHIYGVIGGSLTNQDGATNGITAPSSDSQRDLELAVYKRYQINPEDISYIEAHGTGTKLGDPIEITALSESFGKYTDKKQFCGIGSVKTNIGHASSAAGVSSVIKALLTLKHGKIPPSLHFNQENEHFNLADSPFYVNTKLTDWSPPNQKKRLAAVSGFGLSGTNCHMILEEAPQIQQHSMENEAPFYLVALSAKTDSSLQQKIIDLKIWLEQEERSESIRDISFTMLLGRSHFAARCVLVVSGIEDLVQMLENILAGNLGDGCYRTVLKKNTSKQETILLELGSRLLEELQPGNSMKESEFKTRLISLAELYSKGYELDWSQLYSGLACHRVSLPTYPFNSIRCWVPEAPATVSPSAGSGLFTLKPHPLIDFNTSTFEEERFLSRLTGNEFYLTDHVINKQKVFPAVACMEMARVAGELASGKKVTKLKNLIWARPIVVEKEAKNISISLVPNQNEADFKITAPDNNQKDAVHSQGKLVFNGKMQQTMAEERIDLEKIKERCTKTIQKEDLYKLFQTINVSYGPTFRSVRELYVGNNESLSCLQLAEDVTIDHSRFVLHPTFMDGALQTTLGLTDKSKGSGTTFLPFVLGEVEILGQLAQRCFAYATPSESALGKGGQTKKFNILLTDEKGIVLVKLKDFSLRAVTSEKPAHDVFHFQQQWLPSKSDPAHITSEHPILRESTVLFDTNDALFSRIKKENGKAKLTLVKPGKSFKQMEDGTFEVNPTISEDYKQLLEVLSQNNLRPEVFIHRWSIDTMGDSDSNQESLLENGVYSLFHLTKALATQKTKASSQLIFLYPGTRGLLQPQYAGIGSFARTVMRENPKLKIKTVATDLLPEESSDKGVSQWLEILQLESERFDGIEVKYSEGLRSVKRLRQFNLDEAIRAQDNKSQENAIKKQGVYLITGGLGGIGYLLALYLAKHHQARLVLTGRSGQNDKEDPKIDRLRKIGGDPIYMMADIAEPDQVHQLASDVNKAFGKINGIFHCAGIIRDSYLRNKPFTDFKEVLRPKVQGTLNLFKEFSQDSPDFLVLFSAMTAMSGNPGQSDYAFANSFMDCFSEQFLNMTPTQDTFKKVLSINWPLWKDGGMKVNKQVETMMEKTAGMTALSTEKGIEAIVKGLRFNGSHFLVVAGEEYKIRKTFGLEAKSRSTATKQVKTPSDIQRVEKTGPKAVLSKKHAHSEANSEIYEKDLLEKLNKDVLDVISAIVKIDKKDLDLDADLSEYGFDSINLTVLANQVNEKYSLEMTPAIFFELDSQDISSFIQYLSIEYREHFLSFYGLSSGQAKTEKTQIKEVTETVPAKADLVVKQISDIPSAQPEIGDNELQDRLIADLTAIVCEITKIGNLDIDPDLDLSEYGFDSINLTALANQVNSKYSLEMTPAVFFELESPNISSFAAYMAEEFKEAFISFYQPKQTNAAVADHSSTTTQPETIESGGASLGLSAGPSPSMSRFETFKSRQSTTTNSPISSERQDTRQVFQQSSSNESIAIIGIAGTMPGSRNLEEFWNHLEQEKDLITEIPEDRWPWKAFYGDSVKEEGKTGAKWGGFIYDIDKFDAPFFHISRREAELMDPQQRLVMEAVWTVFEDAGYSDTDMSGTKTGLFIGVSTSDYSEVIKRNLHEVSPYATTGMAHSILVNRISFLMNLHGPSEPIDTACSSSLVAIHRGIEAIRSGSCEMAVAGGVNVILSASLHISFSKAGMLSDDGHCKTFDKDANGYVRGEGAGVVLLKPLSKAIAENDHIYGIIRSTSENHGGHANSLTAPNANAQADLLIDAYSKSGFGPDTVSYIEAHGTGTSLGDPVEVNGLKKAFRKLYKQSALPVPEKPHCGIASVKTNIGHLETAAGIAGVLKVLLAMKHGKLPASINFQEQNPYIDFTDTPFYVVQKTKTWERLTDAKNNEIPRRAGVSSFGFGGANAHVVLEEYIADNQSFAQSNTQDQHIIVLSAANEDRLMAYATNLLNFIQKNKSDIESGKLSIVDMSFTLQQGRKAMVERLAVVVFDFIELKDKLEQFVCNKDEIENLFRGNTKKEKSKTGILLDGESGEQFMKTVVAKKEFSKLAQLWVSGIPIDWRYLYEQSFPRRIALPTYPFARDRYWISSSTPKKRTRRTPFSSLPMERLHPLLDKNSSNLKEQSYSKVLTGEEFYLTDHVIGEQKILPGVAHIEMARAAGELAGERKVSRIKDVVWARPIHVNNHPANVHIRLKPAGDHVQFEIIGKDDASKSKMLHSQGQIFFESSNAQSSDIENIDLDAVKHRCGTPVSGTDCYDRFRNSGFNYGPGFQAIKELYTGEVEALARLELQPALKTEFENYVLHPSLLDGALQTVSGIKKDHGSTENGKFLPFILGQIDILNPLTDHCYVHARQAESQGTAVIKKYDITVTDESGQALVRLKDFSAKAQDGTSTKGQTNSAKSDNIMTFVPSWELSEDRLQNTITQSSHDEMRGNILVFANSSEVADLINQRFQAQSDEASSPAISCILVKPGEKYRELDETTFEINPESQEDYLKLVQQLLASGKYPQKILHLWSEEPFSDDRDVLSKALSCSVFSLFYLTRALLSENQQFGIQLLYIFLNKSGIIQPQYEAVSGFVKSLMEENRRLIYKTIEIELKESEPDNIPAHILDIAAAEFKLPPAAGSELSYRKGQRWVKRYLNVDLSKDADRYKDNSGVSIKKGGVYVITGGNGGLGKIFTSFFSKRFKTKIALIARSTADQETKQWMEKIKASGAAVQYLQADISVFEEVESAIAQIKQQFGHIDGIIHAAGVIRDDYLTKKTRSQMDDVFAAKIWGSINLDRATKKETLDFFAFFSSVSATKGNAGQTDYAFANAFMDGFAKWREDQQKREMRQGKTISFNWPLWRDGGMKMNEQAVKLLTTTKGIVPLSTEDGIRTFLTGLSLNIGQLMVISLLAKSSRKVVQHSQKISRTKSLSSNVDPQTKDSEKLKERLIKDVVKVVSGILKLDSSEVDLDDDMNEYGFDSISLTEFANILNQRYTLSLTPAVFFEYNSLSSFTNYLCSAYESELTTHYQMDRSQEAVPSAHPAETLQEDSQPEDEFESRFIMDESLVISASEIPQTTVSRSGEPTAIIGMSGRMPQSDDLNTFWQNLIAGKDLISEVPMERWDWRQFEDNQTKDKINIKWGGFIDDVDKFDSLFFGISPREAIMMDPQQRLILETVWKTIEDAGYKPSNLSGSKTALFIGAAASDYADILRNRTSSFDGYSATGLALSILANRISFQLNLNGPSEPIDTACSSSLVAIHRAVETIRNGICETAIAGGVNTMLSPNLFVAFSKAGMLSEDGRCKTFDERANGYVRGEGVGAIFLKSLSKAEQDGDHIYAIIRGSAENHGGKANALTAPNPNAQAELIVDAYKHAGIDPSQISYIEAHGTGTKLGDPVEINGLKAAFAKMYEQSDKPMPTKPHCGIGSVKTNIGHLETAAGIAGIFKVVLAMKHQYLPATINHQKQNPYINFDNSPLYIVKKLQHWEPLKDENQQPIPRIAGVSSFGFGGSNAHVILEEYNDTRPEIASENHQEEVILLSAKSEDVLRNSAQMLLDFLNSTTELKPAETHPITEEEQPVIAEIIRVSAKLLNIGESTFSPDDMLIECGFDPVTMNKLKIHLVDTYKIKQKHLSLKAHSTIQSIADAVIEGKEQSGRSEPAPSMSMTSAVTTRAPSLTEVAYTLQMGREAFEERLALIVSNLEELKQKLALFCQNAGDIDDTFYGNITAVKKQSIALLDGDEGEEYIHSLLLNRKLVKLTRLWIAGIDIDWKVLYGDQTPKKISMPTYPFIKDRCWLEVDEKMRQKKSRLHPLVGENTSNLKEQKFSTRFGGQEFYFTHHVVNGQKILPAVAYIEMAYFAGQITTEETVAKIRDIVWSSPIIIHKEPISVDINLTPDDDIIRFEVARNESDQARQVYSQGKIIFADTDFDNENSLVETVDVEAIKQQCQQKIEAESCYDLFRKIGLNYGPKFRTIKELYFNENSAISLLEIPSILESSLDMFTLHPSLMDGAFQTIVGVMLKRRTKAGSPFVPYSLDEIVIHGPLPGKCYAEVSIPENRKSAGQGSQNFNLRMMDMEGRLLISVDNFVIRALKPRNKESSASHQTSEQSMNIETTDQKMLELLKKLEMGELNASDAAKLTQINQ